MTKTGSKGNVTTKKKAEPSGKAPASTTASTGTARTARQQAVAARKSLGQDKRGKSIAVPSPEVSEEENEEHVDEESEDEQVPKKKTRVSKGKGKAVPDERDRENKPTQGELYDHLMHGVGWTPTRFADIEILKEIGIEADVQELLGHMQMTKLLTMAYPTYKDVTCQFLSSLRAQFHDSYHAREGWGRIIFTVHKKTHRMGFKEIGSVMGFPDLEHNLPPKIDDLVKPLWKLLTGRTHIAGAAKNSHIRSPPARYLHRMLVHAFYPRKQHGTCTEEDLRLLAQAIIPYVAPEDLPTHDYDLYDSFGMVGFFVSRLQHYRDYAWTAKDKAPVLGIGGMITPLLQHMGIRLGEDSIGPHFMDANYLSITTYFSGRYMGSYVYYYGPESEKKEVLLPNRTLTSLENPGAVRFEVDPEYFLRDHGVLQKITEPKRKRPAPSYKAPKYTVPGSSSAAAAEEPLYGQRRYEFDPYAGPIPPGAIRAAHEHIGRLQRWNKAQDRTIEKLKDKCKSLSKQLKHQAKTTSKFMGKIADIFTSRGMAGCSRADFEFPDTPAPRPARHSMDLGFPETERQRQRRYRNPPILPSTSGNKSPSLEDSDDGIDIEEVQSQPRYQRQSSAPGGYYTTFPPDEYGASGSTHYP